MDEDIYQLKKQHSIKENQFYKDKALYEQKIQLLEQQLEDCKSREANQRKLNEAIQSAINETPITTRQTILAEFQKNLEAQQKEWQSIKDKQYDQIVRLESQVRHLKEVVQEKDQERSENELQYQKQYIQYDHRISVLEQEKQSIILENNRLKEQLNKLDDTLKSKDQSNRLQFEKDIQKLKDDHFQDFQSKQQDYEAKYQQLSQLYEKEKEALQQRIQKCQNTIKKYQEHIEQNIDVVQLKQKYDQEISKLREELHQQSVQSQYEKKILSKQIEDLNKQNVECRQQMDSTSKKNNKARNSMNPVSDSPIQCKSFHIGQTDIKMHPQLRQSNNNINQSIVSKINQSFERQQPKIVNENPPIAYEEFNLIKSKKIKSQSTASIQTNHLTSYLQEASIQQKNNDSFEAKDDYQQPLKSLSKQLTNRGQENLEPQRRSISQQGFKSSVCNLSKILNQNESSYSKQNTQVKTNNTSFTHFKVPIFTQNQLNSIRNSQQYGPQTTLRTNENHINSLQAIKQRYQNSDEMKTDTQSSFIKQNKENYIPSKSVHINNEIKFLIGKLLQAKGKLSNELESQKSFRYTKRIE